MNERIKQLADEAAKFSAIMALPTGESGDKLFVEKFAELIVEDCVKINLEVLSFTAYARLYERYQEHFGVTSKWLPPLES